MKAQEAQKHAEKIEKWKQAVPLRRPARGRALPNGNVQVTRVHSNKKLVSTISAEAQAEARKKQEAELEIKNQVDSDA